MSRSLSSQFNDIMHKIASKAASNIISRINNTTRTNLEHDSKEVSTTRITSKIHGQAISDNKENLSNAMKQSIDKSVIDIVSQNI